PLITVLVVSIVTMLAIQPVAGFLSEGITSGINGILSTAPANAPPILKIPLITVLVVSIVTMLAIQPVAGFLSE
ncbi:hypothetical protein ACT453_61010, partial [Bacillus sp. D-CC]